VVTKYALARAFASRIFTGFYVFWMLPPLLAVLLVYLSHNLPMLQQMGLTEQFMANLVMRVFDILFGIQVFAAFFVAMVVSPSLVAADLSNHALPLYLSRPIDRKDYVVGKMLVLFVLISPLTWLMGLLVFALQSFLEGGGWWITNHRIAVGYLVGYLVWILVVSMLSLAISAWVRFKPVARAALFGVFFILAGFGEMVNGVTGTSLGDLFNLGRAIGHVFKSLFGEPIRGGLPVIFTWTTLAVACLLSTWMLNRKLRAHEVVA
jgi:ABC-2 type transport system permease protein